MSADVSPAEYAALPLTVMKHRNWRRLPKKKVQSISPHGKIYYTTGCVFSFRSIQLSINSQVSMY